MSLALHWALWWVIVAVIWISPWNGSQEVYGREVLSKEPLLSMARPESYREVELKGGEEIERLLLGTWPVPAHRNQPGETRSRRLPFGSSLLSPYEKDDTRESAFGPQGLYPGSRSLRQLQETFVRLASLGQATYAAGRQAAALLDVGTGFESTGCLVADPKTLYSRFEILVDRANYQVRLFAIKDDATKTLLFDCRAGLGSAEFPTPKGSFYIMRIFDDKPLWIPPQDRWWAWGQNPSRSVYGGHMMPFFTKAQVPTASKSDETVRELDLVAPPVKMVDAGMYRIHGTDSPWSVGSAQSHGCVRLLNKSVATLADLLKMYVGTGPRGESPNGPYVELARPVRLILY